MSQPEIGMGTEIANSIMIYYIVYRVYLDLFRCLRSVVWQETTHLLTVYAAPTWHAYHDLHHICCIFFCHILNFTWSAYMILHLFKAVLAWTQRCQVVSCRGHLRRQSRATSRRSVSLWAPHLASPIQRSELATSYRTLQLLLLLVDFQYLQSSLHFASFCYLFL